MFRRCKNVARVAFVVACLALMTAPAAFGDNLYGYHYTERDLYSVSETDASVTLVGNTGLTIGGMELYTDGFLYGITGGSGATLYRIDPSNAQATEIGPLGIGFVFEGALASRQTVLSTAPTVTRRATPSCSQSISTPGPEALSEPSATRHTTSTGWPGEATACWLAWTAIPIR